MNQKENLLVKKAIANFTGGNFSEIPPLKKIIFNERPFGLMTKREKILFTLCSSALIKRKKVKKMNKGMKMKISKSQKKILVSLKREAEMYDAFMWQSIIERVSKKFPSRIVAIKPGYKIVTGTMESTSVVLIYWI